MRRIKLIVEYEGTNYAGWQRQENALAVQQVLETALYHVTGETVTMTGAGRTDAGVHALGQCVHFDTNCGIEDKKISYALNAHLPSDIRVRHAVAVENDFHARFSATGKQYEYHIHHSAHASAIYRNFRWHVYVPLELERMQKCAEYLVGEHDFAAFMSTGSEVKDTVRTIHTAKVTGSGDEVIMQFSGNGFLYNMVRIMVGTLVQVGAKKLPIKVISNMLETGNRALGGPTAPPHGLILTEVFYQTAKKS